jgi:hypothetical protein
MAIVVFLPVRDDYEGSRKDTRTTQTSNCATDDESLRIGCSTADRRADLKYRDSHNVNPFDWKQ